ncbi:MAG: undecaprenyl-phosphate glucose phosphotransferase [Chitinophagaceae bacterium]|nr:undecaprenyl-phosphate glucose phosphotransferase [Anaerolineae bacterium]
MDGDPTLPSTGYQRLIPRSVDTARSNRTKSALSALLVCMDVLMLAAAFVLAYVARLKLPLFDETTVLPPLESYLPALVLHVTTIITMFYFSRLYHLRRVISRIDFARTILGSVTIGSLLAWATQDLLFRNTPLQVDYLRGMFFYACAFSCLFVVMGREAHRILQSSARRRGIARDNLLIVGTSRIARDITQKIQMHPELGYKIVGVVNSEYKPKGQMLGIPILGLYNDLPAIIDSYGVEQVIIALPDARRAEIVDLVTLCQRGRVDIKVYPDIFAYMAGEMNVDDLSGIPLLTVRDIALRGWKLSLKRGLDIFGAFIGLVCLSPLLLLTALMIRLESDGPVFYTQIRMGLDGLPFPMVKFRSMRADAEADGPGWTVENDPRVTRMGRFMRRTNWDEIPQLVNVLVGQMSLVGPRPERPHLVQEFRRQIPRYMERHREKAGMTGWAQVNGLRGDTSIPQRTSFDLWYVENWSLWLDIKIILRTIWQTIRRDAKNAY